MKIVWLWAFIAVVFTVGAIRFVMHGHLPKGVEPVRVINASTFDTPEQIGAVLFRRYWQETHLEKLLVFASSPHVRAYDQIWRGFLAVATEAGLKYDAVYSVDGLRPIGAEAPLPLDWSRVAQDLQDGKRVLVHTVSTDASLEELRRLRPKGLLLVQSLLPLVETTKNILESECKSANEKSNATLAGPTGSGQNTKPLTTPNEQRAQPYERLSCLALGALRRGKNKPVDPTKLAVVVERTGPGENLMYIYEPTP